MTAATGRLPGRPERRIEDPADVGPGLHVVDAPTRAPLSHRARARVTAVLLLVVVGAALFGLVTSHVALTQGQFRLDEMRRQAGDEQDRYERLRLQVAELESPQRIVAAAQERLGMVPPPGVTYLSPVGPVADAGGKDVDHPDTEAWSSVKRQLASRP
ncbi:MAG TPA: cell division protein FtsL [Acidimicrobiales bacterium]|nr:cell division protein FtsL [Acidimicrobiales bacterium]